MQQIIAKCSKTQQTSYYMSFLQTRRWAVGAWTLGQIPTTLNQVDLIIIIFTIIIGIFTFVNITIIITNLMIFVVIMFFIIYVFWCSQFPTSSWFRKSNLFAQVLEPSACLRRTVQTLKGSQCRILVLVSLEDFVVETNETVCN